MTPLVILSLAAASAADAPARRYALVAGSNDGGPERVQLQYATSDARSVARVLAELGGVAPTDQVLLLDPTKERFEESIEDLGRRVARDTQARRTEVVVYYSGHSDETGLLLGGERYPYKELREDLDALPADVRIAIVDSCSSGTLVTGKGGQAVPAFLVDAASSVEGHAFLTSSAADEASQEAARIGGSFFTHSLVTGLRGGADVDMDRRVTLNEAYQFAYSETLARTQATQRGAQHPAYDMQLSGTGDLVITDVRSTSATMGMAAELSGRIFVRDADGVLAAELFKPAGRSMELGLPPGRYGITVDREGELFEGGITLIDGQTTTLDWGDLDSFEGELTVARGSVDYVLVPLSFSMFPIPTSDGVLSRNQEHVFAVGFPVDHGARLSGLSLALGGSIYGDGVRGGQFSVGWNHSGGASHGLQAAVGANTVLGSVNGGQLSVGSNVAMGELQGLQATVGYNQAVQGATGAQLAVGANVAPTMVGLQTSAGLNYAGSIRGLQLGEINVAGQVHGGELGLINVAKDFVDSQTGLVNFSLQARRSQIGLINVAGEFRGLQLGLVNVARHGRGASIALIPIVGDGMHHLELFSSLASPLNLAGKLGTEHVYTVYTVGYDPADAVGMTSAGIGLGVRLPVGPLDLDADALMETYTDKWFYGDEPVLMPQGRAALAWPLAGHHLAPFLGASLGSEIHLGGTGPSVSRMPQLEIETRTGMLTLSPGLFAGVRL